MDNLPLYFEDYSTYMFETLDEEEPDEKQTNLYIYEIECIEGYPI